MSRLLLLPLAVTAPQALLPWLAPGRLALTAKLLCQARPELQS